MVIIPNLYLKNLYFKSLRWFGGCLRAYAYSINILSSKNLIFDKKLNLLEK
ncbi:orotate phosphoribosyltransferase [Helicobacter pylori]|uniref:Orotate phosphoribosyltransferase n=1 Tax=Helicobacter pylori TaxID=210 RepID=A0A1Q9JBP9_HELPX|nr:orotate phosphoribosyltransferase [Helicobacter pylori]OLR48655.1 orotate phosphoribosyltransferase [Helicobacter pylori]